MKIIHISDNHLGKAQFHLAEREEDLYRAFNQAIDLALSEKPDLIVHTGDLFDSYRPHPRAFVRAFEGFLKVLEEGVPIAIIEGNHELGADTVRKRITSPLINLEKIFNRIGYGDLFVRLSPRLKRFGDLVVAGIPYASRGVRVADAVENLNKKAKNLCSCPSVLMIHQGVKGMIKAIYPEVDFSDIARSSFDYTAMGHYHNKVVRRSGRRVFAYSGSTEVIETREVSTYVREGKYILSVDIDRDGISIREIKLKTRPFISFSEKIGDTKDLYGLIERLSKNASGYKEKPVIIGKVQVTGDLRAGLPTIEIRRALLEKSLHVNVREFRESADVEEKDIIAGISVEELVRNAIGSMKLDEDEKRLSLRIFDLWYREGKRRDTFVKEVLKLSEEE